MFFLIQWQRCCDENEDDHEDNDDVNDDDFDDDDDDVDDADDADDDDDDGDDDDQVDSSLEDAGGYFQHTGESINVLLVNNFAEMEEVNKLVIMNMIIIAMIKWSWFSW